MKRRGKEWRAMRANHLRTYPDCLICEDDRDTVVHHVRYRGAAGLTEKPGDLVTLCDFHHEALHAALGRGAPPFADQQSWWTAQRAEVVALWDVG